MARLPQIGGDEGDWGDILNDYLGQAHNADGTLKDDSVGSAALQDGAVTASKITPGTITKSDVGLGSVDNTADADKPVSTATQTALNAKVNTTAVGAANGVAPLGADTKIDSSYLPATSDLSSTYVRFLDYGSGSVPARPSGTGLVIWVGDANPLANMAERDIWIGP